MIAKDFQILGVFSTHKHSCHPAIYSSCTTLKAVITFDGNPNKEMGKWGFGLWLTCCHLQQSSQGNAGHCPRSVLKEGERYFGKEHARDDEVEANLENTPASISSMMLPLHYSMTDKRQDRQHPGKGKRITLLSTVAVLLGSRPVDTILQPTQQ
jgi:hypothetical protein